MAFWSTLKGLITKQNKGKIHSFTYFIPAPPKRQRGYREKQFDKVFFEFVNRGFEIVSVHTQALSGHDQPGMWVLITVQEGPDFKGFGAEEFDWSFQAGDGAAILEGDLEVQAPDLKTTEDESVDGLYFIKNNKT